MRPVPIQLARPLLVVAALLAVTGSVVAAVDGESGADRGRLTADAPSTSTTRGSTTTTPGSTTSSSTPDTTSTTAAASPSLTIARSTTTTRVTLPPVTAPPTTMGTVPPTGIPAGAAQVILVNETDVPLDIAVNQSWLRMAPGQTEEGFVLAELGATNSAPGQDLVVAAIPTSYGLRDEGCGDSRLGQLLSPGKSYRIRFYNSGTCQLLGGGPKPTIAITLR